MKPPQVARSGGLEFNMTPMIDVVFLLIIFFLVSSHLAQQESRWELALPEAETGQDAPRQPRRHVVVNVLPEGLTVVAGRSVGPDELEQMLRRERQTAGEEELELLIRTDRQVPYLRVEPLLAAAARAGVWRVAFAVYPKND